MSEVTPVLGVACGIDIYIYISKKNVNNQCFLIPAVVTCASTKEYMS